MSPLIFPYTTPDNRVLKKIEGRLDKFSLFWIKEQNQGDGLWSSIYDNLYEPPKEILEKAHLLDRYFSDKYANRIEIDFASHFLKRDFTESETSILKELKGETGSVESEELDEKDLLSYFFLLLFDRHERTQQNIDIELEAIEKKELDLFSSLKGVDELKPKSNLAGKNISLSFDFKTKRLLFWISCALLNKNLPNIWITDDEEYIDFFKEYDKDFKEDSSAAKIDETNLDCKKYITSLSLFDLVNKIFREKKFKSNLTSDEKLVLILI